MERQEMEAKLRTTAKLMVLKDRESWRSERQQLLAENEKMRQRLSVTAEDRKLKADLHKAEREFKRKEKEMGSLNCKFKVLEKRHDDLVASQRELKKESKKKEEVMKERDEEVISLQQSLHAQKEEAEQLQASFDHHEESSGLRTGAEWQSEVHQLQELLTEKEQELRRLRAKRRARTLAHLENLAQLTLSQQRGDFRSNSKSWQREMTAKRKSSQVK